MRPFHAAILIALFGAAASAQTYVGPLPSQPGAGTSAASRAVVDPVARYIGPTTMSPWGVRKVDQGFTDRDALAASLYGVETLADFAVPSGFEHLYEDANGRLYRFDGAVGASFPRSEYQWFQISRRESVELPVVPAGTVFHIGPPGSGEIGPLSGATASDARITNRLPGGAQPVDAPTPPRPAANPANGTNGEELVTVRSDLAPAAAPTILTDHAYRARRLAELLGESRRS